MTPTYALQKYIMKNQQIRPGNNSYKILPKNGQPHNTSEDTSVFISSVGNGHGIILTKFFQRNSKFDIDPRNVIKKSKNFVQP